MLSVVAQVRAFCERHALLASYDHLLVGVSGGPDSLCLLHILQHLSHTMPFRLTVAHLNHQLRGDTAAAEAAFVEQLATAWGLPVIVETADVATLAATHHQSLEEAARLARYHFFARIATQIEATKIAVGHHADDQTETILMHFLRGSGLYGLRGMQPQVNVAAILSTTAACPLIRPLLEIDRPTIEAYCQTAGLAPRVDESNRDTTFFRNRLRHDLIPYLETYNPNMRQRLRETAAIISADVTFLEQMLDEQWPQLVLRQSHQRLIMRLATWRALPLALKRLALRRAIYTVADSLRDVGFEHIESGIAILDSGQTGTQAMFPQAVVAHIAYTHLIFSRLQQLDTPITQPHLATSEAITLAIPGDTPLPHTAWFIRASLHDRATIEVNRIKQAPPWEAYLDAAIVGSAPQLRTRQSSDSFQPFGMGGHQSLKNFMINHKIPASWRNHIPLLVQPQGDILWICGYRLAQQAAIQSTTTQILHVQFIEMKLLE